MECPNCAKEVPASAKVCGYCGAKLPKPDKVVCAHCGKEIPASARVCGYCGTKQAGVPAIAPVAPMKEAAEPAAQASKLPRRPPRRLPRWLLPALAVLACLILVGAFLLTRSKASPAPETPAQPTIAAKTQAPVLVTPAADAPAQQPAGYYYVPYNCTDETVPADTHLRVRYGWTASTAEQVLAYFLAAEHQVYVDGAPVKPLKQGFELPSETKEGYPNQRLWMDIGSLPSGAHEIKTVVNITQKVFDGQDWYGPGTDTPSFERVCALTVNETSPAQACLKAVYISETIPDGSIFRPGESIAKSWTLRNTGTCAWTDAYQLVFAQGDALGAESPVGLSQEAAPGDQVTFEVPFTAPSTPGAYDSYWKLQSANGEQFFQVFITLTVE